MRAFIGVPIGADLALELLAHRDAISAAIPASGPRAIPAANFHLTLAFLGDIDAEKVDLLDAVMQTVAEGHVGFLQPLTRLGSFPGATGKIIAAQGSPVDDLRVLVRALHGKLVAAGVGPDQRQRFVPHVTLARLRLPVVPAVNQACQLQLKVDALVLFESLRRQGRVVYRPLRRVELRA